MGPSPCGFALGFTPKGLTLMEITIYLIFLYILLSRVMWDYSTSQQESFRMYYFRTQFMLLLMQCFKVLTPSIKTNQVFMLFGIVGKTDLQVYFYCRI